VFGGSRGDEVGEEERGSGDTGEDAEVEKGGLGEVCDGLGGGVGGWEGE
jgi:hypothetical protein